ncbi:unnamed protein product [Linum trigynum]|uniref:Uncharacterized protein n=1 Tax=Linum trigynum TaxID=586398 RepID=A0AAV2E9Q4_9ROSI
MYRRFNASVDNLLLMFPPSSIDLLTGSPPSRSRHSNTAAEVGFDGKSQMANNSKSNDSFIRRWRFHREGLAELVNLQSREAKAERRKGTYASPSSSMSHIAISASAIESQSSSPPSPCPLRIFVLLLLKKWNENEVWCGIGVLSLPRLRWSRLDGDLVGRRWGGGGG